MNNNNYCQQLNEYHMQNYDRFIGITKEIFINTPFKEFSFQKFYVGGEHLSLFSNIEFSKYYFDERNDLGKSFCNTIKSLNENQTYFSIWPSPDANDSFFSKIYRFNIGGGLTIHRRVKNYVDTFHFSGEPGIDMTNFYINNKQLLLIISQSFLDKAKDIIDVKSKSILGIHTGKYILDKFEEPSPSKQGFSFFINGKQIWMTPQELKCLNLLTKGFTTKWIAKELGLSPRTIESYLNSIKLKCNVWGKDVLVELFHKSLLYGQN